ncbi:hypothetical protein [Ferrovibrio terrae]|uniref:hypothetical protein n=1 Tax=Ferrovibrio terrae TaxID=2594003 RepID=UPI0031382D2F
MKGDAAPFQAFLDRRAKLRGVWHGLVVLGKAGLIIAACLAMVEAIDRYESVRNLFAEIVYPVARWFLFPCAATMGIWAGCRISAFLFGVPSNAWRGLITINNSCEINHGR